MKYFLDTEFIESFRKWSMFGRPKHFVDLISIGIVSEDGRTYYAISNQFNPDEASDWVKGNVLYPIMQEYGYRKQLSNLHGCLSYNKNAIKRIQKAFGKHPMTIGLEIREFCGASSLEEFVKDKNIEFYGYYSDYDWVVFCSMFGTMIDLPKGFPMYCKDLKQMFDEKFPYNQKEIKSRIDYPKQMNEHNALDDAKWNKKLYEFITK